MSITGPVILDNDGNRLRIVCDGHGYLLPRIVDCIFNEVAKAVNDAGVSNANRLLCAAVLFHQFKPNAELPVRGHHLLDQGRERQAAHVLLVISGK